MQLANPADTRDCKVNASIGRLTIGSNAFEEDETESVASQRGYRLDPYPHKTMGVRSGFIAGSSEAVADDERRSVETCCNLLRKQTLVRSSFIL